jgi:hypothetical protein
MKYTVGYKLFRVRKNGTLGSLFIDRKGIIEFCKWLKARAVRTPGFAFRPGWHACSALCAPHLSTKGRRWFRVHLRGVQRHERPASQGGLWYTAKQMYVLPLPFATPRKKSVR